MLLRLLGVTVLVLIQFTAPSDVSESDSGRKNIKRQQFGFFLYFRHNRMRISDANAFAQASTLS